MHYVLDLASLAREIEHDFSGSTRPATGADVLVIFAGQQLVYPLERRDSGANV
jgi:hypothetical protein